MKKYLHLTFTQKHKKAPHIQQNVNQRKYFNAMNSVHFLFNYLHIQPNALYYLKHTQDTNSVSRQWGRG
jgi:hypothetical protein